MVKRVWELTASTLAAVAASGVTAAGAYCLVTALACFMDGDPSRHPVTFPVSVAGGVICAGVLLLPGAAYIRLRRRTPSVWRTVLDVSLAALLLLPFFDLWRLVGAALM